MKISQHWHSIVLFLLVATFAASGSGCGLSEVDAWMGDPSKTGRFEHYSTTIPILDRLEMIEGTDDMFSHATEVTSEDLVPNDLSYRLEAGDFIRVEIYELYERGQWFVAARRIDAGGNFRLPDPIGDLRAAGRTAQTFQDHLHKIVGDMMTNPLINVTVEEGAGFTYTVYGSIGGNGVYMLRRPDFRLRDALAQAGGVSPMIDTLYVIRPVVVDDQADPFTADPTTPMMPPSTPGTTDPPVDINDLIDQLDNTGGISPGMLQDNPGQDPGFVDIDQLEPVRSVPTNPRQPVVDIDQLIESTNNQAASRPATDFTYDVNRGEWVPVGVQGGGQPLASDGGRGELILERVIRIPYENLRKGDSSYNIVIRPGDAIYVKEPKTGQVYIDGDINRPGVYSLPLNGRLTLSRLVAAAGGPNGLAVPDRVDLTRMVGNDRQAIVRLNVKAIRNGTAPDVYLKPDDHIIMGTNFLAQPAAVIRSGFRMTYGFGFLLDRNFGGDVFGAEPRFGN